MFSTFFAIFFFLSVATCSKLFVSNFTNTVGFNYPVYATSFDVNLNSGVLQNMTRLPNAFNPLFEALSAAVVCGKYYISIVTDAPISAAIAVADTTQNTTFFVSTYPNALFHTLACDPESLDFVWGVVNNPFDQSENFQYSAVRFNWRQNVYAFKSKPLSYNLNAGPIFDSFFSVIGNSSYILETGTSSVDPSNSGTINVLSSLSNSSSWKSYSVHSINPYQIVRVDGSTLYGLAFQADVTNNEYTLQWGTFTLHDFFKRATFKAISTLPLANLTPDLFSSGLPYVFCQQSNLMFTIGQPEIGQGIEVYFNQIF